MSDSKAGCFVEVFNKDESFLGLWYRARPMLAGALGRYDSSDKLKGVACSLHCNISCSGCRSQAVTQQLWNTLLGHSALSAGTNEVGKLRFSTATFPASWALCMSCVKPFTIISIKITEWLTLEGTSGHHLVQFPQLKQGHSEPFALLGLYPDGSWISPRLETPQTPSVTCVSP